MLSYYAMPQLQRCRDAFLIKGDKVLVRLVNLHMLAGLNMKAFSAGPMAVKHAGNEVRTSSL